MKISTIPAVMVLLFLVMAVPNISNAANLKIGVISFGRLLHDSPQGQAAQRRLNEKIMPRRSAIQAEQKKARELQDDINKNGSVMSSSALQEKQSRLSEMQRDLSRKESDLQDEASQEQNNELTLLQQEVARAVNEFAKKNHYNLIIGSGVYYADDTVNVTAQILAQMQQDYKAKK